MLQTYYIVRSDNPLQNLKNIRNQQVRSSVALPPVKKAQPLTRLRIVEIKNYAKRNSTIFITRDYTTIKLTRLSNFYIYTYQSVARRSQECIRTADARRIVRGSENSAPASPLVHSDYALQECSPLNVRHIQRPADAYNKIGTHRGYSCICSKLSQTASPQTNANIIALIGTVLYNAIKEYYDDRTRKTIYFHSHTVEDNYNAIRKKWKRLSEIRPIHANYIKNSRSNVTVPDDYHDNDVNDILIKCIDNKQQRYNTLIEDYNCAGKREDNILTVDKYRTSHSNKKDIEANEREEETRVQLRESSEKIHDILLREFRRANNFTESITHNDDEQDEFAILAEKYTIDNRIIHALPEDCDALVERYEEEINCSDLYSTM
ncbi:hypothetical protein HBI64_000080 [Parastagonospora nodorum]|nr:hypothetical protein HBI64_000080 [Parastagonospora nodorum]